MVQLNDIESDLSDLDDVSILQIEDVYTSDITLNYSSDVGTRFYLLSVPS